MDDPPPNRPLWNRPISSLTVGDVAKGYALYIGIGLVVAVVFAVIVFSSFDFGSSSDVAQTSLLSWSDDAGDAITPGQYFATSIGESYDDVRRELGKPASSGPPLSGEPGRCLGYRSSESNGTLYTFCFEDGKLAEKDRY